MPFQHHLHLSIIEKLDGKRIIHRRKDTMRNVLGDVFLRPRGGDTRMRIIEQVHKHQLNAHQLKVALGLDYSTIRHSLRVLEKNHILTPSGSGYGAIYRFTPEFKLVMHEYDALTAHRSAERRHGKPRWEANHPDVEDEKTLVAVATH